MGIAYEIEHYGAVESTEEMILIELGLGGPRNQNIGIKIEGHKLLIRLQEVGAETDIALGRLLRLALRHSDAVVVSESVSE